MFGTNQSNLGLGSSSYGSALSASIDGSSNLIVNGSFEDTVKSACGTRYRGSSNTGWGTYDSILGWKATAGGKIEVQRNGVAGQAYDGKNLVELDSDDYNKKIPVLGMFQDVQTTIGQSYTLSFMYSARPNTSISDNAFSVLVGDSGRLLNQQLNAGAGGKQTNWLNFTINFVADSTVTRLQFNYDGGRNTFGAYVDDVKMTASAGYGGVAYAGYGGAVASSPAVPPSSPFSSVSNKGCYDGKISGKQDNVISFGGKKDNDTTTVAISTPSLPQSSTGRQSDNNQSGNFQLSCKEESNALKVVSYSGQSTTVGSSGSKSSKPQPYNFGNDGTNPVLNIKWGADALM